MSEIFTIPTKPAGPVLPKWITGESPAPEVYHQVLEASVRWVQSRYFIINPRDISISVRTSTEVIIYSLSTKAPFFDMLIVPRGMLRTAILFKTSALIVLRTMMVRAHPLVVKCTLCQLPTAILYDCVC